MQHIVTLPILTFDERVLSPRFGYVFQRRWLQPYESVVGMLWKFARMNGLPGHTVAAQLSPKDADPYEGFELAEVDVPRVARLLGVTQRSVRAGIGRAQVDCSPHLRFCPKCIGLGYHGRAQQLLRHARCPIHGKPLQAACRRCERPSPYRLDAQLLDAPFKCRHCRAPYALQSTPAIPARWALATPERAAITRASMA